MFLINAYDMENFNLFWLTNVHPYIYQRGHELMICSDAVMSVFYTIALFLVISASGQIYTGNLPDFVNESKGGL